MVLRRLPAFCRQLPDGDEVVSPLPLARAASQSDVHIGQPGLHDMFGLRKSKPVVGLDIGSSAVKAVELRPSGSSFKVTAFGVEPVPPDTIVDGAIIDGAAVAD